jgi:ABC-type polysaccharide/polyol phosphate transport system ATPase subunit
MDRRHINTVGYPMGYRIRTLEVWLPRLPPFAHQARWSFVAVSTPQLAARGIVQIVRRRQILRGADIDVAAGSRIGVLGPNGGGKSTFLRILAGSSTPTPAR